ncbi:ABC transporter ATP-binding protein [Herbiconiux sp. P17]|uniref:ABC transporter ATP-binding protein n=1 Tax=Herbiconiux wuyangfengii TaxID=3342794 RepID=UPI0035B6E51A
MPPIRQPADIAPATGERAFACENVSVTYDTKTGPLRVLENVSFSCARGEFVTLLGPSGTGKTTLLRILAGLLPPGEGSSVSLDGVPLTGPADGVALVFQNYAASLLQWRTVERNVGLGLEGRVNKAELRDRVRTALGLVGLDARRSDYPWQLSGGMQQRVQIARALVMRPEVLLMDEPFGALDAMTKAQLQDQLLELRASTGATVVFVTHDLDEAAYLSDRVMVLSGTPASITAEFDVDLPAQRDQITTKELPGYLAARHRIHDAIGAAHA